MLARVGLALVAVVVLAWTGVLIRDERLAARAGDPTAAGAPSGPKALAAAGDLRRARLLNPDSQLELDRIRYEVRAGRARDGLRLARSVVRREPDNVMAWSVLAGVGSALRDRALVWGAIRQVLRLDPFARAD